MPLVTAHRLDEPALLGTVGLGVLAFGLLASAGYVVNDLVDRVADRAHPVKAARPFARGALSPATGVVLALLLAAGGLALAARLPPTFLALSAIYLGLALGYSLVLKRQLLLDVLLLAGLYTLRVMAGGAAVELWVSPWLLAFSMFIFLSLAVAKRYAELTLMQSVDRGAAAGRAYRVDDMDLMLTIGTTSGFVSVLILSLYINSEKVLLLYSREQALWFLCPLLLYWILRIWFLARRGELPGDPVLFAIRDVRSLVVGLLVAATLWAAL